MPIIIGRGKREYELAIRIYQLAKQLKIDNKALVDTCKKLGFAGKGSALASLSDDQVAAIKEHLSGGRKKPAAPEPEVPATPKREEKTLGRVRTLPPTPRAAPEPPSQEEAEPAPPTPEVTPRSGRFRCGVASNANRYSDYAASARGASERYPDTSRTTCWCRASRRLHWPGRVSRQEDTGARR